MRLEHRRAWWAVAVVGVSLACAGPPTPEAPREVVGPSGGLGGFRPPPPLPLPVRAPVPAEVEASRAEFDRSVTAAVVALRLRQQSVATARREVERLTAQIDAYPELGQLHEQLDTARGVLAEAEAMASPDLPGLEVPYPGLACDRDDQCRVLHATPCDPEPVAANQAFKGEVTLALQHATVLGACMPPPVDVACAAGYCAVPAGVPGELPERRPESDGEGFEYVDAALQALDERWGGEVVGPPPFDYDALMKDRQAELDGTFEALRQDLERNPTPEKQEAMRKQIEALVEQGKAYRPR